MDSENVIQLSGPFSVTDSLGRTWNLNGIRIFDEGYGIIDVYVDFASSMDDAPLYEDACLIGQILGRLRTLGYAGPDFGPGDPGMHDDRLIVLEAPEEFGRFAASRGWKNLAAEYDEHDDYGEHDEYADAADDNAVPDILSDPLSQIVYAALMHRLGVKRPRSER